MHRSFIETLLFSKQVDKQASSILKEIQMEILKNPECGDLVQGTGGLRKLRLMDQSRGKGKRGGFRVIYLDLPAREKTYLLTMYGKGDKQDISADEKKTLRFLVQTLKREAK